MAQGIAEQQIPIPAGVFVKERDPELERVIEAAASQDGDTSSDVSSDAAAVEGTAEAADDAAPAPTPTPKSTEPKDELEELLEQLVGPTLGVDMSGQAADADSDPDNAPVDPVKVIMREGSYANSDVQEAALEEVESDPTAFDQDAVRTVAGLEDKTAAQMTDGAAPAGVLSAPAPRPDSAASDDYEQEQALGG